MNASRYIVLAALSGCALLPFGKEANEDSALLIPTDPTDDFYVPPVGGGGGGGATGTATGNTTATGTTGTTTGMEPPSIVAENKPAPEPGGNEMWMAPPSPPEMSDGIAPC